MKPKCKLYPIKFKWQLNVKIIALSLFLFPILIALGFWQLERADEKTAILDRYEKNRSKQSVDIVELDDETDLQHRPAFIIGTLIGAQRVFLDYKVKYGKPGYEVYEHLVFQDLNKKSDKALLVNRGWVQAPLNRDILPDVESIESPQKYKGTLYRRLKGGIILDDGITVPRAWPARLGSIDVVRAQQVFESPIFFKYQLRLDQGSLGSLDASWETVSTQPSKHLGYAFQWFVMSFVLLIMTVFSNSNAFEWIKSRFKP